MMSLFSHPRYRPIIGAVLMALAGALAVSVIWAVFAIRTTQVDRIKTGDNTARAAVAAEKGTSLLVDCLTIGGDCYERQQARTAEVLGEISEQGVRASAAIAVCQSRGIVEYEPLVRCAVRLLTSETP